MKKIFVPCYRVVIKFYDYDDKVFRCTAFEVDYFKRDRNGLSMYERIAEEWCIPYQRTVITFERIKD